MSRGLSSSIKDEFDRTFTPCSSPRVSPLAVLFATRLSREGLRMNFKHKVLLFIDGIVNLLLGVILLFFPAGLLDLLGLPPTNTYFYASILGAVIFGIGVALLLELYGFQKRVRGLGLGGAIAINLCGGGALMVWLVAVPLSVPLLGKVILWIAAAVVLIIGLVELVAKSWKYQS